VLKKTVLDRTLNEEGYESPTYGTISIAACSVSSSCENYSSIHSVCMDMKLNLC